MAMNKGSGSPRAGVHAGFSLIEVLAALVVLTVGIMGFMSAFSRSIMQTNASRNDSQCVLIANAIAEELRARPFDQWGDLDTLASYFSTNFYGDRSAPANAFYEIDIAFTDRIDAFGTAISEARDVIITVSYGGWTEEQAEAGFESRPTAFVLETTIINQISEDIYGELESQAAAAGGSP